MKRVSLAICDSNRLYCERLGEYLRNNYHVCIRVVVVNAVCNPCNARRGVSSQWLINDVLVIHFRKLLVKQVAKSLLCADVDILFWNDIAETVVCLLQHTSSRSKEINKLFRLVFPTAWPQTLAKSSCQYNAIVMIHHSRF